MSNTVLLKGHSAISIVKTGRYLFAVAVIGFGLQHIVFGDFIAGRAPAWPTFAPGKIIWAYLSGGMFIITGLAVLTGRSARALLVITGTLVFFWALLRYIPILAADLKWGTELTRTGKALTLFGGLFAVAGSLKPENRTGNKLSTFLNQTSAFIYLGRYCLGIFMIICGVQHFIFIEFVQQLVPAWIPGPVFWTYFAGIVLIAGGTGLLLKITAPLAAMLTGIMIFLWFVMLHIPRAIVINNNNEWIAVAESLAFSGIAFVIMRPGEDR